MQLILDLNLERSERRIEWQAKKARWPSKFRVGPAIGFADLIHGPHLGSIGSLIFDGRAEIGPCARAKAGDSRELPVH
jgi:hypothetical protein